MTKISKALLNRGEQRFPDELREVCFEVLKTKHQYFGQAIKKAFSELNAFWSDSTIGGGGAVIRLTLYGYNLVKLEPF